MNDTTARYDAAPAPASAGVISDAAVVAAANKLSKIGLHYHWFAQSRADLAASDPIGLSEFDGAAQEVLTAALPFLAPQRVVTVTDEMVRAFKADYAGTIKDSSVRCLLTAALAAAPPADHGERVLRLVQAVRVALGVGAHGALRYPPSAECGGTAGSMNRLRDAYDAFVGAAAAADARPDTRTAVHGERANQPECETTARSTTPIKDLLHLADQLRSGQGWDGIKHLFGQAIGDYVRITEKRHARATDTRIAAITAARAAAGVQPGTSGARAWTALADHMEAEGRGV